MHLPKSKAEETKGRFSFLRKSRSCKSTRVGTVLVVMSFFYVIPRASHTTSCSNCLKGVFSFGISVRSKVWRGNLDPKQKTV